jgi:uncharacterized protein (DUF849 family)
MPEHPPLIIEAAINEQSSKGDNPAVPYSPEECVAEAVAAADAGATIIHFHARDPVSGELLVPGTEAYAAAMRVILQKRPGLLVYPTYGVVNEAADRFRHVDELARDDTVRLPLMTLDPGWADWTEYDPPTGTIGNPRVLPVPHDHCRYMLELCQARGVRPSFVVRELGHVRSIVAYHRMGLVEGPILMRINLSDDALWGAPPSPQGIRAYLDVVPRVMTVQWMAYTYGPSHWAMNLYAVGSGGHVRTGLGDNSVEPDGQRLTNADKVAQAVEAAAIARRRVATIDETRALIGA